MFALLTGTPPFECSTVQDTLIRIKSGKFELPSNFSASSADLIQKLLTQDPKSRLSVDDILKHQFIKSNCEPKVPQDQPELNGKMVLSDLINDYGTTPKSKEPMGFVTLDPDEHKP